MSWPEENIGPVPPRITTRHVVVGLGPQERVVELDEQAPVLGVAGVGPVQEDPHDRAVVVGLVLEELVVGHCVAPAVAADEAMSRRQNMTCSVRIG